MINVRTNIFETNSSSVHAMIITKEKVQPDMKVYFGFGEYGWENRTYYDTKDKAAYFYTAACSCYGNEVDQKIKDLLEPYDIQCEFARPVFGRYSLESGYIDHSYETVDFVDALLSDADMLIRYLFSEDSFVVTSNDNEWDDDYIRNAVSVDYDHVQFIKGN